MDRRLTLQQKLEQLTENVYFQTPSSHIMIYPCIRFKETKWDEKHADNKIYLKSKGYQVTIIDENPDSELPDNLSNSLMCQFDRTYVADNLNHWVFNLYF